MCSDTVCWPQSTRNSVFYNEYYNLTRAFTTLTSRLLPAVPVAGGQRPDDVVVRCALAFGWVLVPLLPTTKPKRDDRGYNPCELRHGGVRQ